MAFHGYPTPAHQSAAYDVQNPYAYPVRNANVAPCQISAMLDNRTALPTAEAAALPTNPNGASSSISYVPVVAGAADSALPTQSQQAAVLRQQPTVPLVPTAPMPHPNGHMAAIAGGLPQQSALFAQQQQQQLLARQQAAAAQFAAQQLAASPTANVAQQQVGQASPAGFAETTAAPVPSASKQAPYPTYETDAQVEFQRQQALAAERQRALAQQSASSWQPAASTAAPAAPAVSTETPSVASTPATNDLSRLSAQQLEEYASRLRNQMAQEKAERPAAPAQLMPQPPQFPLLNIPQQPLLKSDIRGRINGASPASVAMPAAPAAAVVPVEKPAPLPTAAVEATSSSSAPNLSSQVPLQPVDPATASVSPLVAQQILPPGMATVAPKLTHEINYCDRRLFDDEKLAAEHLKRADYFVYNTSCSGVFFQCAIGQTFVLKCPSVETQAFDPAISSCNFKNSVRFCPEYDHVLHCTIRETCEPRGQFACCASQQCIDYREVCDGHRGCLDGEDETNCPSCARDEFACVKSATCIPATKRCDGKLDDCGDGSNLDEIGCSRNETCWGKFVCDSAESIAKTGHAPCIENEKFCDGQKDCPGGEDELNCRQSDDARRYLSCENQKQSVRKEEWCDGKAQCLDGSDEKYCF